MAPAGPCRRSVRVAWVRLVTWVVTQLVTRRFNDHDLSRAPNHAIERMWWCSIIFVSRELQRGGVDAISLPGRLRTIGENVAEMGAAVRAKHLFSTHPVA